MRSNSNYQRMQTCNDGCPARDMNPGSSRNRNMNCYGRRNQGMDCDCQKDDRTDCNQIPEQFDCTCLCEAKPVDRCGEGKKSIFSYPGVSLGMAYVPIQRWENLFDVEQGICNGSIFKDLVFPFKCTNCPTGRRGM